MLSRHLVQRIRSHYRGDVPVARRPVDGKIPPVHRPSDFDSYEGQWVAVLNHKVIAAAPTSRELAAIIHEMATDTQDSVIQFVRPTASTYVVGVG